MNTKEMMESVWPKIHEGVRAKLTDGATLADLVAAIVASDDKILSKVDRREVVLRELKRMSAGLPDGPIPESVIHAVETEPLREGWLRVITRTQDEGWSTMWTRTSSVVGDA